MRMAIIDVLRRVPGARETLLQFRIAKSRLFTHRLIFTGVYREAAWGTRSVSGYGSAAEGTEKIRAGLPELWRQLGVRTLVDAPCGDFGWMRNIVHHLEWLCWIRCSPTAHRG